MLSRLSFLLHRCSSSLPFSAADVEGIACVTRVAPGALREAFESPSRFSAFLLQHDREQLQKMHECVGAAGGARVGLKQVEDCRRVAGLLTTY
jgi:hypothetical protein